MLDVHLLGSFVWMWKERPISAQASRGVRLLLATLALWPGQKAERAALAKTLWPDSSPDQARTNLRKVIYQLKAAWPGAEDLFQLDGATVGIRDPRAWRVDVHQFLTCLEEDHPEALRRALTLYRGDLLPEANLEWLDLERERLRSLRGEATHRVLKDLVDRRAWSEGLELARLAVAQDPLQEDHWCQLFIILGALRDGSGLDVAYRRLNTVLRRELGVEPSTETRKAYGMARQLVGQGVAAAAVQLPAQDGIVGQEAETMRYLSWLREGTQPIFNLWGPGGGGKSIWLRQVRAVTEDASHPVLFFDGAGIVPTPRNFWAALPVPHGEDPWAWLTSFTPCLYFFWDHWDISAPLARFFFGEALPRAGSSVRWVVSGRRPLTAYGPLDCPWRSAVESVRLTPWSPKVSAAFLGSRGMTDPGAIQSTLLATCGNPLAMSLAAENAAAPDPDVAWQDSIARLAQHMLREATIPGLRQLLEGCSVVPWFNAEMMERWVSILGLPSHPQVGWFDRLAEVSALHPVRHGFAWHPAARYFISRDFSRRCPDLVRRLRAAAKRYLRESLPWVTAADKRDWLSLCLALCPDPVAETLGESGVSGARSVWEEADATDDAWVWHIGDAPGLRGETFAWFRLIGPDKDTWGAAGWLALPDPSLAGGWWHDAAFAGAPVRYAVLGTTQDAPLEAGRLLWQDLLGDVAEGALHLAVPAFAEAQSLLERLGFRPVPLVGGGDVWLMDLTAKRWYEWLLECLGGLD